MTEVRHVGIILDGNRRFAKKLMLNPWKGHEWGAQKVEKLLDWCQELGIHELTIFAFSMENFNRPKEEFDYLMNLFRESFEKLKDDPRLEEAGIRVRVIGRWHLFPEDIQKKIRYIMEKTQHHNNYVLNVALAYGGRQEIADAARKIAAEIEKGNIRAADVTDETFPNYLYMADEPDFIIRTGGDRRISNFLLYQGSYSEFFFIDKTWPEFEKEDLARCVEEFKNRERRFGR